VSGDLEKLRILVCTLGAFGALIFAGCGGSDEPTTTSTTTTEEGEVDENGFPANAHVQPDLGVVPDGIDLDGREGTPPGEPAETDIETAAEAAGCQLETGLEDEGNTHIDDEDAADVDYQTDPPTSGDHYGNPTEVLSGALADGAYLEPPPVGRVVHALEHQRVAVQYSPDLSEEDQLALKGVFDADPKGVIFFPNADMPYDVAATAWTNLLGCDTYDGAATLDAVQAFRDSFRGTAGDGPEPIPLEL
jgi:hypothetical protein